MKYYIGPKQKEIDIEVQNKTEGTEHREGKNQRSTFWNLLSKLIKIETLKPPIITFNFWIFREIISNQEFTPFYSKGYYS